MMTSPWMWLAGALCLAATCAAAGDDAPLNIFIIPHTHDDVGWLEVCGPWADGQAGCVPVWALGQPHAPPSAQTVDNYYISEVQWILDTVLLQVLPANPARKMTYVEISFFQRWWQEQTVGAGCGAGRAPLTFSLRFVG